MLNMDIAVTIEDLSELHQEYARVIGVENLIALSKYFGGTQIYIPKVEELLKNKRYRQISEEYDGTNIQELAVKYHISESTIYRIVRDKIVKGTKPMPGQMTIADCFSDL